MEAAALEMLRARRAGQSADVAAVLQHGARDAAKIADAAMSLALAGVDDDAVFRAHGDTCQGHPGAALSFFWRGGLELRLAAGDVPAGDLLALSRGLLADDASAALDACADAGVFSLPGL